MAKKSTSAEKPVLQESKKEHVSGVRPLGRDGENQKAPLFGGIRLEESITIGRPAEELYNYWRDFTNLPKFCKNLKSVEILDGLRSKWTAEGPGGKDLSWEATIIDDRPYELVSWRTFEGADFDNTGSVRFKKAPADRGTEVHISFAYNPPAGPLGSLIAKLSAKEPAFLLKEQLRRFKQLMETGEIATTDGQPVVDDKKK